MKIVKPFTSNKDPHNHYITRLHFYNGVLKNFYMRGAITCPEGEKEGFAIMAGMDLTENVIIVFEQFRFWTVNHWLNPDGTIHQRDDGAGFHLGLMQFINDNNGKYRCVSYFRGGQHVDTWIRYGKEVYTNPECPRTIELIEVPYVSEIGPNLLLEKINTAKFRVESDSWLAKSVERFVNMRAVGTEPDNPTRCLMTLLAGFDHCPGVRRNVL